MAMDELEISKIVGAGCAALLAFVGFGQLGSAVVGVDQLDEPAYQIEIAEADTSQEVEEEAPMPIGQVMAMAVVDDGPKVFRKCSACHNVDKGGANGVGPALYGVVGRDIGGVDGYAYSGTLAEMGGQWDFAALDGFLEAPRDWAPGTKMGFAGLSKPEDRASVIAWMNEQSDAPLPMPAADATEAPAAVEEAEAPAAVEEAEAPAAVEEAEALAAVEEAEAPAAVEEAEAPAAVEEAEAPAAVEEAEAPAAVEEAEAPAAVEEAEAPAAVEEAEAPAAVEEAEAPAAVEEAEAPAAVEEAEAPAAVEEAEAPAAAEETEMAMVAPEAEAAAPAAIASAAAFMIGADAKQGAKVFRKCKACHKVNADGGNGVGPNLHGVVGREIGSVDGYKYSDALMEKGGVWDFEALAGFLTNPKEWAPGTKMAYRGLRKEQDRADVIAYLNENSDAPVALPE